MAQIPVLDVARTRELLQGFDFSTLFLEQLGWSQPRDPNPRTWNAAGLEIRSLEIARLGGVVVLEMAAADGKVPDAKARLAVYREVVKVYHENLLVFMDGERTQSLWYWVRRDGSKLSPRDHFFFKHQPGDLFLSKLSSLVIDVTDLDAEGNVSVAETAKRLRNALDVERVTKRFYDDFQRLHERFLGFIDGIDDERDRRWYASVLLNRLMFVYFLQKKHFLDRGDLFYLRNKLEASRKEGADLYYSHFLHLLFFEGFAKPEGERSAEARRVVGEIRYLDGGLFLPHKVELANTGIRIPDAAFEEIFDLFERYSWNLNDTPGGDDNEINPDVLGYIFERYINQKQFGAYYTRPEITRYLCEKAIHPLILERVNALVDRPFERIQDLLLHLNPRLCRTLWKEILPKLSILDPACGSGAFLVAALKTLIDVYAVVIGWAKTHNDNTLRQEMETFERQHPSTAYGIKKRIITDNLFGVDIMEEATEIAKLRLFLTLVASANRVEDLEPLPNIDFNILPGNSLIGLLHVQDEAFENRDPQRKLFRRTFRQVLADKNRLIDSYRHATSYAEKLQQMRDAVEKEKEEAKKTLNEILFDEFKRLGIKYEEATWDVKVGKEGKPKKRLLTFEDIKELEPFHWGYEFDQVLGRGGFDVILTNPPWEVFKPQAKEFFAGHSEIVTTNKMTIKEFEKEQAKLLKNKDVRDAWLRYQGRFPHVSQFFRSSPDYANQIAIVNGKKAGTDLNLYKLFLERCFRLLSTRGRCGILLPTSVYADLGAKGLREMLFEDASVESLIGLSNEKYIFEGVHHSFRICMLAFHKSEQTSTFKVAFRINTREAVSVERLESFLSNDSERLTLSLDLIKKLSPDSLSILEFKTAQDVRIAEKVLAVPRLGERGMSSWDVTFAAEFHMTNDSHLFRQRPGPDSVPLFEGKMVHQFDHQYGSARYWISEKEGRRSLLGREKDVGQDLDYEDYRLAFRRIGRDTDERTMIAALLPPRVFASESLTVTAGRTLSRVDLVGLVALFNSLTLDYLLRQRVAANISIFYVYQLPVPHVSRQDPIFAQIVSRSAMLCCTTAEFAELWRDVMGTPWSLASGAVDKEIRHQLKSEIDGLVAHLYCLTEDDLRHILSTFPVVSEAAKTAVLAAYKGFSPKPGDPEILALIAHGESHQLEFKSTLRWDLKEQRRNEALEVVILHTVVAFLNAEGGTLLIGVADDGSVIGLEPDYKALGKKGNQDGFALSLTDRVLDPIGRDLAPAIRTSFHKVDGKDVCRVVVSPSPRPVFLKTEGDAFWLRTGNSTRKLSPKEAVDYCKARWK